MNKRNLFVRITAIVLCAIMVLSVVSAAIYAFAADETVQAASVNTGSPDNTWVIVAIVAAILVVVACVVIPMINKKK